MLLLTAAIEFEGKIAGVTFKKGKVDPALLKALVEPFANVLPAILKK